MRALALACLAALCCAAASASELFSERIDVVEIQLEVLVADRDGRPVDDLARDDFRVKIGGETVKVVAAELVTGEQAAGDGSLGTVNREVQQEAKHGPSPEAGTESAPADGRSSFDGTLTMVLFVDEQNLRPGTSTRVLEQVSAFLDAELRQGDRVMVVTHHHGVEERLPLTGDLAAVRAALRDAEETSKGRGPVAEERKAMRELDLLRSSDVHCNRLKQTATTYIEDEYRRTLDAISALHSFVEDLGGLPGRKAIVHVSDGLPMVAGLALHDFLVERCSDRHAPEMSLYSVAGPWHQLAARANRNNVTFYPLQASGLRDAAFVGADFQNRELSPEASVGLGWNRQDALVSVAVETGGAAILNTNRVIEDLRRMESDLRHYYRLSVRPSDDSTGEGLETGRILKIDIEVDRPGVEVRHRKSLRLQTHGDQVAAQVLASTLHAEAAALDNAMALRARVEGSSRKSRKLRTVRMQLDIPFAGLTLLPSTRGDVYRGVFTVFVVARGPEGGTTEVRRSTLAVDLPEDRSNVPDAYTFGFEMDMRKGEHLVAIGVLDEIGGETSYVRIIVGG